MNNKKNSSAHTTFNKHKPFVNSVSCCNPWRELISQPFSENALIVGIDINSLSQTICIFRTDLDGNPSKLNIEVTHWMELGDMCKPGARKCRYISAEEKEIRGINYLNNSASHVAKFIIKILIIIFSLYMSVVIVQYLSATLFFGHTIDKVGNNLVNVIGAYKK